MHNPVPLVHRIIKYNLRQKLKQLNLVNLDFTDVILGNICDIYVFFYFPLYYQIHIDTVLLLAFIKIKYHLL